MSWVCNTAKSKLTDRGGTSQEPLEQAFQLEKIMPRDC